jgi:hypothetical protein
MPSKIIVVGNIVKKHSCHSSPGEVAFDRNRHALSISIVSRESTSQQKYYCPSDTSSQLV